MTSRRSVAVVSFPGNNCEVETVRAVRKAGLDPLFFRWNDDRSLLKGVDAFILPGGFSYEDRGRSGMVAARDSLFDYIGAEAERGATVLGICNGAQMLVESGLIPNANGLEMCLAHNEVNKKRTGFISRWIWMCRSCKKGRAAATDWDGVLHVPIAHGEGRFVTKDNDLLQELGKNDQIVFQYCNQKGVVNSTYPVTPNGSTDSIAGLCNPAGNVVCLMPHPERSGASDIFFSSFAKWLTNSKISHVSTSKRSSAHQRSTIQTLEPSGVEIFIGTTITNNEEKTVEQAIRRLLPTVQLKQWTYIKGTDDSVLLKLSDLTVFNANKQRAFIRRGSSVTQWDPANRCEKSTDATAVLPATALELLRLDTNTQSEGILYSVFGADHNTVLLNSQVLEVLHNPHASTLVRLS